MKFKKFQNHEFFSFLFRPEVVFNFCLILLIRFGSCIESSTVGSKVTVPLTQAQKNSNDLDNKLSDALKIPDSDDSDDSDPCSVDDFTERTKSAKSIKDDNPSKTAVSPKSPAKFKTKGPKRKTTPAAPAPGPFENIDIDKIVVEKNYKGPNLINGKVTLQFMKDTILHLIKRGKWSRPPKVHFKYTLQILRAIKEYYMKQDSLIEINVPAGQNITVVGDIHGSTKDLIHIFTNISGLPSPTNYYLFNGDFVDRGKFSIECALILFGFKLLYPKTFFINRGNHEDEKQNAGARSLDEQCDRVYGNRRVKGAFHEVFRWLPLAYRINERVLVIHGGLFQQKGVTLNDIKSIKRGVDPEYSSYNEKHSLMFDLLWSDPWKKEGREKNFDRWDAGILFGPDVSKAFCKRNNIDYIIRSHQPQEFGYSVEHDGKIITVFSIAGYYKPFRGINDTDITKNSGAVIKLGPPDLKPHFFNYTKVDREYSWNSYLKLGLP